MIISERIFEILRQKKMSQNEFSKRTGIGQSTISDWKRKKTNPSADKILTICDVLEVSPEELLSGAEQNGRESRKPERYIVEATSELGNLISDYQSFSIAQRNRLLGYADALKEMGCENKNKL